MLSTHWVMQQLTHKGTREASYRFVCKAGVRQRYGTAGAGVAISNGVQGPVVVERVAKRERTGRERLRAWLSPHAVLIRVHPHNQDTK